MRRLMVCPAVAAASRCHVARVGQRAAPHQHELAPCDVLREVLGELEPDAAEAARDQVDAALTDEAAARGRGAEAQSARTPASSAAARDARPPSSCAGAASSRDEPLDQALLDAASRSRRSATSMLRVARAAARGGSRGSGPSSSALLRLGSRLAGRRACRPFDTTVSVERLLVGSPSACARKSRL